jgi:hypothetical protein
MTVDESVALLSTWGMAVERSGPLEEDTWLVFPHNDRGQEPLVFCSKGLVLWTESERVHRAGLCPHCGISQPSEPT